LLASRQATGFLSSNLRKKSAGQNAFCLQLTHQDFYRPSFRRRPESSKRFRIPRKALDPGLRRGDEEQSASRNILSSDSGKS